MHGIFYHCPLKERYDVIIVGCGPAGIFTALELTEYGGLDILMLDRGLDIDRRVCPASRGLECTMTCNPCSILYGWGGAGAFSDGKLHISTEVGGWLSEYIDKSTLAELAEKVDGIYLKFGAPDKLYGTDLDAIEELSRRAAFAGLTLIPVKLRHMGTEKCLEVLRNMYTYLKGRVDIATGLEVKHILVDGGRVAGVSTGESKVYGRYVVLAPGRSGSEWLVSEARRLGLNTISNPVDLGVRVEVPAAIMEELTDILYEPKFVYYSKQFDDKTRMFCVCPYGRVITERYEDIITVNGESYFDDKTRNTNFAILVSTMFTEPFKEPIAYGKYIARLANIISGGVIVQRLGDLRRGRRSTPERISRSIVEPTLRSATPGDLSYVLPYRYLTDIVEMLDALDRVAPGIASDHTLLYGVEVKFYSSRLKLSKELETEIGNLYAVGDGAGVTRSLMQASISGIIAARGILRKEGYSLNRPQNV